ncbi:PH domain-containing protein [Brachybacterium sp. NPDC056505]|uniref:PH domain-containing protein n=1 Tax=Brachybacterium sp. NPDC056505 TaxID=3345843 RepID=UPI003671FF78
MSFADPTRAEQTFFAVMQRNDEPRDVWDLNLPEKILAPDETVIDVKVGDTTSDTNPLLIATDRRVLLAKEGAIRSWRVLKQAPAAEVVGVDYKPALLSGKLRVHLRDGSAITLTTATKGHAERFVATMRGLLEGAQRPRR